MNINNKPMESKYWTNHLIIREMKILERYPSNRLGIRGKVKSHSQYDFANQRRGVDVGDTDFLPRVNSCHGHSQCQSSKNTYFCKGNLDYDGDNDGYDDADHDDSVDSDDSELSNQLYLPRLQVAPSNALTEEFLHMPTIHKNKFTISYNSNFGGDYYNYGKGRLPTKLKDIKKNDSGHWSEEHDYRHRNGFIRQYAITSDEDNDLQNHGSSDDNKHVFSKPSRKDDANYPPKKNRRRTKASKYKDIWAKNSGKTNEKFVEDRETDGSDGYADESHPVWVTSDERLDDAKTGVVSAREKGSKIDHESAAYAQTKKRNHKTPLATRQSNITRQRRILPKKKMEEELLAKKIVDNNGVFQNTQKRIVKWMSENYGRVIDVFKKFDVDDSGSLSMEEFYQGMKELGAPGTQVELYMMAKALDRDGDETIDYHEFRKIRNMYKKSAGKRTRASNVHVVDDYQLPKLQPCSKCCIGITEPAKLNKYQRHISVRMSSISQDSTRKSSIAPFVFDASPEMTIYGIQRLTKAELGGSATNVRIFRRRDKKTIEILEQHKTLGDYGYQGSITSDNPDIVTLFYDYTYPALNCPLVSASLSR